MLDQLWGLATTWYSNRFQEDARRPKPEEMSGIFEGLGLTGEYWDPRLDSFE